MVENRNQSIEFSDEAIRRFLLGRLNASEQPAFEQQLFSNSRLDARVRLAELGLADDYAYERISADEHVLFADRFLVSSARRHEVEVSIALHDRFAFVGSTKSTFIARARSLLRLNRPAWRYTFAVLIFILLVGGAWVIVKKEGRIKDVITKRWGRPHSPSPIVPVKTNHPTNNSLPEHQTSPPPMPVHDQTSAPSVNAIIALTPASSPNGGNIPSVKIAQQDIVRLQIALRPYQPGTYPAELLSAGGQSVFSAEATMVPKDGTAQIDFDVPAGLLKAGNYQVRLSRDHLGAKQNMGRYYFRVQ
jgi:hypothetical protein